MLPAGALAGFLAQSIGGLLSWLPVNLWGVSAESSFVFYLRLLLVYVLKEAAFVIAGARWRRTAAAQPASPWPLLQRSYPYLCMLSGNRIRASSITSTWPPKYQALSWGLCTSSGPTRLDHRDQIPRPTDDSGDDPAQTFLSFLARRASVPSSI